MSLFADASTFSLVTNGEGDFWDACSEEEPPFGAPSAADGGGWVRMRAAPLVEPANASWQADDP
ncbi:hypothetical protein J2Z21_008766 [Streptomyces griseochromogenes]|uniref:Uncharacterized protein n=1 Tax=Streptomyces griseochromogenes TaxID=68214 RepID=A0A1B1B0G7_9ACTN|nr:hypothetical protein [Streptomyces griseochromogenes]ANP52333.1 hypothetical protein AVL59_24800 [Streptomyces griseochromogenes]MBP2055750.1 hypothetical protein [Streptomyces griseochromogenes]